MQRYQNGMQQQPPQITWHQQLLNYLYPPKHCPLPPPREGVRWRDTVRVTSLVVFSWRDRLRILLTGRVIFESQTATENEVGETDTNSVCYPAFFGAESYFQPQRRKP